jgi:hypothetical protein
MFPVLVVIADFDVDWFVIYPGKRDPILLVDTHTPLPFATAAVFESHRVAEIVAYRATGVKVMLDPPSSITPTTGSR